jgi:hypothetical protein
MRCGATPEEWAQLDLVCGLTQDLLPVVSNRDAVVAPGSTLKEIGKTPSQYNRDRRVVGIRQWTSKHSTSAEVGGWMEEPDYGICIQTRTVRALDVDVPDVRRAELIVRRFEEALGLSLPLRMRSNSGKRLVCFRLVGDIGKRSFKCEGGLVEFLATGQQFIGFGTHPSGVRYEWPQGLPCDIPTITLEQFEAAWATILKEFAIEDESRGQASRGRIGEDLAVDDDVARYLEDNWETYGVQNGKLFVLCPWKDGHSKDSGESEAAWLLAGSRGYQQGHFECLHTSCSDRADVEFQDAVGYRVAQFEVLPPLVTAAGVVEPPLPAFARDGKGAVEATVDNVRIALERVDVAEMDIRWDEFQGEVVFAEAGRPGQWQPFCDHHYTELRLRLGRLKFKPIGRELIRDMVHYRARMASIDTAMVWIDSLQWDGVERVERFWSTHFGVEDTAYSRACGLYTWTALAARVLKPGCQVDMTPILTGPQGLGKSSGVKAMVPNDMSTDMSFHEPETERARKMRGKLVVELAELTGLRTREVEAIKAWITRRDEHWTPKYQEMATVFRRRCVIFGTTNDETFLEDPTGERRWLPMTVAGVVNVELIERDRQQLWAEARVRFEAGGVEWKGAQELATAEHANYRSEDPWAEAVRSYIFGTDLAGQTPLDAHDLGSGEVVQMALGLPAKDCTRAIQMRIGKILRALGCDNEPSVGRNGERRRYWRHAAQPLTTLPNGL